MAGEEGSKYASLAADERGHCSWFLTRTNKEHQATMEHPFMKTIYAKTFSPEAYTHHLVSQYLMFTEMERFCTAHATKEPLCAVFDVDLHRSIGLARDLRFWAGEAWAELVAPSPNTAAYLELLAEDANDPWLLFCHHFLQYNAVLSGGQFLGNMVSARAGAAAGDVLGAEFYSFPPSCQPTHGRVQQYIDTVDALSIAMELRERMLGRMRQIYLLLLAIFDEAYAISPVEGTSYNESKVAASGEAAGSAARLPPPPTEPMDRLFTLKELRTYSGKTEGKPILVSVVGRVYDVSPARDLFGPGGPYEMFAGHDGTYNLAVMSLKKATIDKFTYEVDDEEKESLADWVAYFDNRYGRPLGVLTGVQHSIAMADLPRATKIPFSNIDEDVDEAPPASQPVAATPVSKL